jgi:uncharacterized protein YecE (DUF72 family)
MIWIGTSGFQYPEWKGLFYPDGLSAKKMLGYYAKHFPTTESNYTFRSLPSTKTIANWYAETPANFRFSLKAPQAITHFKKLRECEETLETFWEAAAGLKDKLGVVLFQLPPYFREDIPVLEAFLKSLPRGMKSAFEFRHESWFGDELYDLLRAKNAALCIADTEKLATPPVVTADFGYFRLRDVGYTDADLKRWAKLIKDHSNQTKDGYVYFMHEETGTGPKFAVKLMELLGPKAAASPAT